MIYYTIFTNNILHNKIEAPLLIDEKVSLNFKLDPGSPKDKLLFRLIIRDLIGTKEVFI